MLRSRKSILSVLGFVVCLVALSSAEAQDMTGTIYLQFQGGLSGAMEPDLKLENVVSSELGSTPFLGAGAAYQIRRNIRADFTLTYRGGFEQNAELGNSINAKADFQSTAAMFNVTYEFSEWSGLTPYITGGLGYVYNHLDQVSITADNRPLANIQAGGWANLGGQIGGGITIPFANDWALDVGYRYFDGGKYESSDTIQLASGVNLDFEKHVGSLSANEIVATLRIRIR
jgi:opacity protein-like surface antigen